MTARVERKRMSWWSTGGFIGAIVGSVVGSVTGFRASAQDIVVVNARLVVGDGSAPVDGATVVVPLFAVRVVES